VPLTNTQLRYYDSNVLRLPADKRKEYHKQVDRLISELSRSLRDRTEIKITRVVKAGSFAKFTILRKASLDPVDVDVVFYISGRSIDQETLESLNDLIHRSGSFPPDALWCTSIISTTARSATLSPTPPLPTHGYRRRLLDELSSPGDEGFSS